MKSTYETRMHLTTWQTTKLDLVVEVDRKVAYGAECIPRSYEDQAAMLTAEKKANPNFKVVFSQVLQDVLRRLDEAYKAFYRRVKAGVDPGYPRFRGNGRYKSFTYLQGVFKLGGSKLSLSKIESIRVFKHREIECSVKTCTIKKDCTGSMVGHIHD